MSKGASREPQEIRIDFAVLPKRVVKDFLIKFTKKSQASVFLSLG